MCYNCKFYGKCSVEVKTCKDFIKYDKMDKDVVVNIQQFDAKWMRLHKKWWMRFNPAILLERVSKANALLSGKTIEEWIKEQEKIMSDNLNKEVESGKTGFIS